MQLLEIHKFPSIKINIKIIVFLPAKLMLTLGLVH